MKRIYRNRHMEVDENNEHKSSSNYFNVEPLVLMNYDEYEPITETNNIDNIDNIEISSNTTITNNDISCTTANAETINAPTSNTQIDFTLSYKNKTEKYDWSHYNQITQEIINKPIFIHLSVSTTKLALKCQFPYEPPKSLTTTFIRRQEMHFMQCALSGFFDENKNELLQLNRNELINLLFMNLGLEIENIDENDIF